MEEASWKWNSASEEEACSLTCSHTLPNRCAAWQVRAYGATCGCPVSCTYAVLEAQTDTYRGRGFNTHHKKRVHSELLRLHQSLA